MEIDPRQTPAMPANPTTPLAGKRQPDDKEMARLKNAAADFEALFVRQMLSVMRKSVPENEESPFGKSQGEKVFRDMLDSEYASMISRRPRGLGFKEALMDHLLKLGAGGSGGVGGVVGPAGDAAAALRRAAMAGDSLDATASGNPGPLPGGGGTP
ncbi:MAG: rod-binding protein [Magnetococcales bacterium]|nr:rod-binding protein [Magnetococcales bacterium]MBF0156219.1 rod-binding protein [Magnetococcales bacterium]